MMDFVIGLAMLLGYAMVIATVDSITPATRQEPDQ